MSRVDRLRSFAAQERPVGPVALTVGVGVVVVVAVAAALAPESAAARWLLAAAVAAALALLCIRSTAQGVVATLLWLFALGASRRIASEVLADPARDPLVLVGAVAAAVLAARALLAGAWQRSTLLMWALVAFTAVALLGVLNPEQPSGLGRAAGLLVWVVPTLWFWVGRRLVDDELARRVLLLVGGVTVATALYGIGQATVGFPPWDRLWIDDRGYAALFIGPETVRPFGSYASAAEFALACAVGAVIAATAAFAPRLLASRAAHRSRARRRRLPFRTVVVGGLGFLVAFAGLVLSAVRVYLALLLVALPVVFVLARGRRAWKVLVPVLVLVALGLVGLSQVDPDSIGKDGPQAAIRRIVVMINDPFVSNRENTDNTLELHFDNAKRGVEEAFDRPLGRGTGSTGIAGGPFGGTSTSTDLDLTDAGIAFGLLGLVLCTGIVVLGFVTSGRAVRRGRTFERVVLVGVLVVSFGAWFQGAHYALAPLLWLLLGRADAAVTTGRTATDPSGAVDAVVAGDRP